MVYARLSGRSATLRTGVVEEVLLKDVKWRGGWVNGTWVQHHHEEGQWRIKVQPDESLYSWIDEEDPRPVYLRFPDRMVVM